MGLDLKDQLQSTLGDRYRVDAELGGGGMARVFAATDVTTGERVAVKVLSPDLAAGVDRERFRREIQVALKLKHPRIVALLSVAESRDLLCYTMPLIDGASLRTLLASEPQLACDQALGITRDVADALSYAHAQNIVHRDIKPGNILIDRAGRALVTDFGIARAIERSVDLSSLTSTGLTLGTPTYMSPEQAVGDRFVDGRSDVYSLGCVLYEMLAGEPPFTGPNAQAIIARHLHEQPRPLRVVRPDISASVQAGIEKALAKVPTERFRTAGQFAEALEHPFKATPGTRRSRRWWFRVGAAVTVASIVLGFLAVRLPTYFGTRTPAGPPVDPRRIAVLDLEDQSSDKSLGYLASGLAVSLIRELTAASAISVVSRNSIRAFRERGLPVDSLVAAFRVGSIVEGSVQRSNNRVRVDVSLVDARTHTPVEMSTIEREEGELFMLEDDLAHEVSRLLRRRIGKEVRVREAVSGTRSARARDLVFRADKLREDAAARSASAELSDLTSVIGMLGSADSLLAAATEADRRWLTPIIERGWVAFDLGTRTTGEVRRDAFRRAHKYAQSALVLQPTNAAALELRGSTLYWEAARTNLDAKEFENHLTHAQEDLETAVRRDSTRATAWVALALVRVARGDLAQAEQDARTGLAMDTYLRDAPTILLALYGANLVKGALDEAWTWCNRGGRDFPADVRFVECRLTLFAEDQRRRPDPREAWALVARANAMDPPARARATGRPWLPIYRDMMAAIVTARAGDADSARAVARTARQRVANDLELQTDLKLEEAYLHVVLGEPGPAIRLLAEYLEARPALKGQVARDARWRSLHEDSTFKRLVAEVRESPP